MSKVRTLNRVVCVDPNLDESGVRGFYPYQFDKLSLYVDLTVYVPNRDGSQDVFNNPVFHVSFMGGTTTKDGHTYLTTNYTDINHQNPSSNTHECLGIESATIAYTSWMVPTVTIKFVDVRGASLFGPEEEGLNRTSGSSFFKALFSFPSPLFRLDVKGYLGRSAVYNLKISKFDGQLNSETGNFEATVDFIGYMYGIYADMPLTYLAVAPYTTEGSAYWNSSAFKYKDGSKMKTLAEFSSGVHSAEFNTGGTRTIVSSESMQKLNKNANEIEHLRDLYGRWEEMITELFASIKDVRKGLSIINWDFYEITDNGINYVLPRKKCQLFDIDAGVYSEGGKSFQSFCQHVNTFNATFPDDALIGVTEQGRPNDGNDLSNDDTSTKLDKTTLQADTMDGGLAATFGIYTNIIQKIRNAGNIDCWSFYFYSGLTGTFKTQVQEKIQKLERENTALSEQIQHETERAIQNSLGFTHTMPNIYSMFFAHMDTFAHLMNVCISNIHSHPRALKDLNWSITNTDLKNTYKGNIPPFTLFLREGSATNDTGNFKNGNKTVIWPGDIPGGNDLEEVKLVNQIIDGIEFCRHAQQRGINSVPLREVATADNIACYPTIPYDWFHPNDNPYSYISSSSLEGLAKNIFATFGLRYIVCWFYRRGTFAGYTISTPGERNLGVFGKIEAYNFHKANPSIPKENILAFCDTPNEDIINYLTATGDDYILTHIGADDLFHPGSPVLIPSSEEGTYEYVWGKNPAHINTTQDFKYWLPVGPSDPYDIPGNYSVETCCLLTELLQLTNNEAHDKIDSIKNCIWFTNDDEEKDKVNAIIDAVSSACDVNSRDYVRLTLSPNMVINNNGHLVLSNNFALATGYQNITDLLKMNSNGDAIRCFSGVYSTNDHSGIHTSLRPVLQSVFGMEAYYLQETVTRPDRCDIDIEDLNLLRKAYCFIVNSIPSYTLGTDTMDTIEERQYTYGYYGNFLAIGAIAWRDEKKNDWGSDPIQGDIGGPGYIYPTYWWVDQCAAEVKILKEEFEKWATTKFLTLKSTYELQQKKTVDGVTRLVPIGPGEFRDAMDSLSSGNNKIKINQAGYIEKDYDYVSPGKNLDGGTNNNLKDAIILELDKEYFENDANIKGIINELFTYSFILSPVGGYSRKKITSEGTNGIIEQLQSFKNQLKLLYEIDSSTVAAPMDSDGNATKKDIQISTYLTLKNLYENWFAGNPNTEKWKLSNKDSQFSKFKYVDSYLRDVGDAVLCNAQYVAEIIDREIPGANINNTNQDWISKSLYSTLSDIAQEAGMMLIAFPTFNSWIKCNDTEDKRKGMERIFSDIFTPTLIRDVNNNDGSSYLCVWPGQASDHLDIPDDKNGFNNYENNGFDLFVPGTYDIKDQIPALTDVGGGNYMVPFFMVDYGNQNQGIFKHISVGMSNPQTTEASLKAQFAIASTANSRGGNENGLAGQDLYRVYSNYSYTCTVEALGNVQILPMMYFQLIHIPMFHGVYQIINVEHSIQAGEMTTKFVGVRVSKHEIPYSRGLQPIVNRYGSGQYIPGGPIAWSGDDGTEIAPIYHFFNDGNRYNSLGEAADVGYDNLGRECDTRDGGTTWREWRNEMRANPPEEGYFSFGESVRNRVAFYGLYFANHCRTTTDYHRCARSVRQYVECCVHKEVAGWDGYSGEGPLTNAGYIAITDRNGKYTAPDGTEVDLTTATGRTKFTNTWALNGDVCLQRTTGGAEHACMFISGYPYHHTGTTSNSGWVSDFMQLNMWVYTDEPGIDEQNRKCIQVYRHKSRMLSRLLCTDRFESDETAPATSVAISDGPWRVARILIPYISNKIDEWAHDRGIEITEEDKCVKLKSIVAGMLGTFNLETAGTWKATIGCGISSAVGLAQWVKHTNRREVVLKDFFAVSGATLVVVSEDGTENDGQVCVPGEVPPDTDIGNITLETQAKFVTYELDNNFKTMLNSMLSETTVTPTKMGEIFVKRFEAPFTDILFEQGRVSTNYCPIAEVLPKYLAFDTYYYNHGNSDPSGQTREDNWWNCLVND